MSPNPFGNGSPMISISDSLIQALPDLTLVVRSDGVVVGNIGGSRLGIAGEPGELIGTSLRQIWTEDIAGHLNLLVRRTLRTRTPVNRHYKHQDRHIEVRVQPHGIDRVLMVLRDVSSETTDTMPRPVLSYADPSVVENLASFEQRLAAAVSAARLRETPLSVAAIHLGGLRDARNLLGTAECSRLVGDVLARLQPPAPLPGESRPHISVFGRVRSDLLMVMFFGMRDRKDVSEAAERIQRAFAEPLVHGERRAHLRPTIGISRFPVDGATAELLLDSARAALSTARYADDDGTISFCSRTIQIPSVSLIDFEQELRWALERNQLTLHYQPVQDLRSGKTLAFEALIRWIHPVCGEMAPDQFLPVAAQSQIGTDIDEWAVSQACADVRRLPWEGDGAIRVEVNIGRRMLETERLSERLQNCAKAACVEPSQLGLNVSERVLSSSRSALDRLRDLRQQGVRVYVDGFGTGRVALERLAHLPIDGIGIDRAFIARIDQDASARAMCRSVVWIARAFGLRSSAAGVETQAQLDFLNEIGCDAAQGRFFHEPVALQALRSETERGKQSAPVRAVGNGRI